MYFSYNVFFEAHRLSINRLPFILLLWSSFKYSHTSLLIFMSLLSHFVPIAFHWQLPSFLLPLGCKGLLEKDISVRQWNFLSIRQILFHIHLHSTFSTYHFVGIHNFFFMLFVFFPKYEIYLYLVGMIFIFLFLPQPCNCHQCLGCH